MNPVPGRNVFGDPATGYRYVWAANHKEEQGGARIRAIMSMQPTKGRWKTVRSVRQQGTRAELIYKLSGTAVTLAEHEQFLYFEDLSLRQTIYFLHAAGGVFECLLSDYEPQRIYAVKGPRGEHNVWPYSMQLDVIAQLA